MTRHGFWSRTFWLRTFWFRTLSLFIVIGLVAAPALHAESWWDSRFDATRQSNGPGWSGHDSSGHDSSGFGKLFTAGSTGQKIAKGALTATGSIVAGLFGSQFGPIGTVIGGAAGFFASRFIADKVFGGSTASHESSYGNSYFTQPSLWQRIKDTFTGTHHRPNNYPPGYDANFQPHPSGTLPNGDLGNLRRDFFEGMMAYQKALASGTAAEKASAKTIYDNARDAYFQAKGTATR